MEFALDVRRPATKSTFFGYDALQRDAESRTMTKYAVSGTRTGRVPPKWITSSRMPKHPRALKAWQRHREQSWNTTVRSYAPLAFKGLKPITMEPWSIDAILFECPCDRIGGRDERDIQAFMLEEQVGYHAALRKDRLAKKAMHIAETMMPEALLYEA